MAPGTASLAPLRNCRIRRHVGSSKGQIVSRERAKRARLSRGWRRQRESGPRARAQLQLEAALRPQSPLTPDASLYCTRNAAHSGDRLHPKRTMRSRRTPRGPLRSPGCRRSARAPRAHDRGGSRAGRCGPSRADVLRRERYAPRPAPSVTLAGTVVRHLTVSIGAATVGPAGLRAFARVERSRFAAEVTLET